MNDSFEAGKISRPAPGRAQNAARRACARGEAVRILPGIYGPTGSETSLPTRAAALGLLDPDAVITRASAAALTWWPELEARTLSAARRQRCVGAQGFEWERRHIPLELIAEVEGLRFASPELTVLDLIPTMGGNVIDEALRRHVVTLDRLWRALEFTPKRRSNVLRQVLLEDSRDEPWSEAERLLHRYIRGGEFPWSYVTNHPVQLSDGRHAFLDAALPDLMLYFEADGYEHHGNRTAFEHDRDRDTDLAAEGWQSHRFSAAFLEHDPDQACRRIRAIVGHRARDLRR